MNDQRRRRTAGGGGGGAGRQAVPLSNWITKPSGVYTALWIRASTQIRLFGKFQSGHARDGIPASVTTFSSGPFCVIYGCTAPRHIAMQLYLPVRSAVCAEAPVATSAAARPTVKDSIL